MFPFFFSNNFKNPSLFSINPQLEEKLSKNDCTLEEILDENDIVNEIKKKNDKIKNFFNQNNIKKLIHYVIDEPTIDDEKISYKYPYISCEILKSELPFITDYFILNNNDYDKKHKNNNNIKDNKSGSENKEKNNYDKNIIIDNIENNNDDINNNINNNDTANLEKEKKIEKENVEIENTNNENNNNENNKNENNNNENNNNNNNNNENNNNNNNNENNNNNNNKNENNNNENNSYELLDEFLSFILTDKPNLNYVLSGYFSMILKSLISQHNNILLYIYKHKKDVLNSILKFSFLKSISDLSLIMFDLSFLYNNLKRYESNNIDEEIKILIEDGKEAIEFRNKIIKEKFINLSNENDNTNKYDLIGELINLDEQIFNLFINDDEILTNIENKVNIKLLENDNNVEIKNNYIRLLEFIIKFFKKIATLKIKQNELNKKILKILEKIIDNFHEVNIEFKGNCDKSYNSLGLINLKIFEIFYTSLPIFTNSKNEEFDNFLISSNFLHISLQLFFNYYWNNLYHNLFENFIKYLITNNNKHYIALDYLHNSEDFFSNLAIYINEKNQFIFNSGHIINNGIYPFCISILYKLNEISDKENILDKNGEFDFLKQDVNFNLNNNFFNNNKENEKKKEEEEKINLKPHNIIYEIINTDNIYKIIKNEVKNNVILYESKLVFDKKNNNNNLKENNNISSNPLVNQLNLMKKILNMVKMVKENPESLKTLVEKTRENRKERENKYSDNNYWNSDGGINKEEIDEIIKNL